MATLIEDLKMFTPKNDEEAADYTLLLEAAHREEAYNRAWPAHFTASAWVVNPLRTKNADDISQHLSIVVMDWRPR